MASGAAPAMRLRFRPRAVFDQAAVFLYVLLLSGAVLPPLLASGGAGTVDLDDGLPGLQAAMAALLVVVGLLFCSRFWRRPVVPLLKAAWLPLSLAALAAASSLWSVNQGLSTRRSLALAGAVLVAAYLVGALGYKRSITLVTVLLALVALLSVLVAVAVPDLGVHQVGAHVGRWKGVYLHKNLLGREMALAGGLFAVAAIHARRLSGRVLWALMTVLAVALIAQAQSATGLVAVAGAVGTAVVVRLVRGRPELAAAFVALVLVGVTVAGALVSVAPDRLFAVVGRDASVTGRTTLWSLVLGEIAERSVLGHGYRAFWGSDGGEAVSQTLAWRVSHAHNSWLDVGLDLGVVGLLIVATLVFLPLKRWLAAGPSASRYHETGVVVTVAALLVSMSDSVLLGPNNLFLLLLFLQCMAGARAYLPAAAPLLRPTVSVRDVSSQGRMADP